ncbi:MAG TPA: peptidase S24 [Legionellales bacterium]|nr:peptidase S24 [Legionellales bacterium]|tara:strand:+ start:304 stop:972 length:669 start_codon:yes stop_codon:yes gene_type:complete
MNVKSLSFDREHRSIIAENLSYLIKLKNTTESKVAQELNIPVMTIRRLLSGETTDPRVSTLQTIASYFDISVDALIRTNNFVQNELISQSKSLLVPVYDWEQVKKLPDAHSKEWPMWVPITIEKNQKISKKTYALESRPFMYPPFQPGTIFILDPELKPSDGDLVLVNLKDSNELTLRELRIDPPDWQLYSVSQNAKILDFSKKHHEIIAVVFLTLFQNRKA